MKKLVLTILSRTTSTITRPPGRYYAIFSSFSNNIATAPHASSNIRRTVPSHLSAVRSMPIHYAFKRVQNHPETSPAQAPRLAKDAR